MVKNIWKQTSGSGQGGSRGKEKVRDKVKTQAYRDLKSEKSINTRHRFIIRAMESGSQEEGGSFQVL